MLLAETAAEAQLSGHELPVDGVRHAGEGPAAEGQDVGGLQSVTEPAGVASQHLEVGEQVVGEEDGLGALHMCIPRHHHLGVSFGLVHQGPPEPVNSVQDLARGLFGIQTDVHGHLVVARPGGVQLAGGGADQLRQTSLHVHVDVL